MKVDAMGRRVRFDLRKNLEHGTTSINQFCEDPNTEVYHGALHTCVTFLDLGFEVEMDPAVGDWKDAEFARATAWDALIKEITPDLFMTVVTAARDRGHQQGRAEKLAEIQGALGL